MERTPGTKNGDAGVKDCILTPGGVTDRRNSRIGKKRKKGHKDDREVKIIEILHSKLNFLLIGKIIDQKSILQSLFYKLSIISIVRRKDVGLDPIRVHTR